MSLFRKKKTGCMFSGFSGQLLYHGEPAAGAIIQRRYRLFFEEDFVEDIEPVIADEEGRFQLESIIRDYKEPFFSPISFKAYQEIFVQFNNEELDMWVASKRTPDEFYEFGGHPVTVTCEITKEPEPVNLELGLLVTNCQWQI